MGPYAELEEATIAGLQAAMEAGRLTAGRLVEMYLARIQALDRQGPAIRSILETNPEAAGIAAALDRERAARGPRGPLHGIPILLKDNIDTADRMETTAGSLALLGSRPNRDATVATRLRDAGAVLLGKTNMSEWANFRSTRSSSGWSARGGQGRNPYALDRSSGGSSSGSGQAVAANLAVASLGTETDGSIVSPAARNGIVGLKPTVGLTSRAGVIPISHSQDTVGPLARTVADAAVVLGALAGADPRDPATRSIPADAIREYRACLDPDGLRGARIGVPRAVYYGYSPPADRIGEAAIAAMKAAGAEIVDPADIPTARRIASGTTSRAAMVAEFQADLEAYLADRPSAAVHSLEDLIAFNEAHAAEEMPFFGQELFLLARAGGRSGDRGRRAALDKNRRLAREEGIDAVLDRYGLDALVAPTGSPAGTIDLINGDHRLGGSSSPAALAGYPLVSVPAGFAWGLPVGITFMGRAYSEPTLIRLAYAFEQATKARRPPELPAALGGTLALASGGSASAL